ncbi:MAG: DRTGG domain-containing protein [Syntrophales bacterium]|nr:DRTGG domain-containing protein [Syntrophales bacterium]
MKTLETIAKELDLQFRCGKEKGNSVVKGGHIGDLLSNVMATSKEGDLWITCQTHQNIVAVASLKDHTAIVICNGLEPTRETIEKAEKEGIPILTSSLSAFELGGKLYKLLGH